MIKLPPQPVQSLVQHCRLQDRPPLFTLFARDLNCSLRRLGAISTLRQDPVIAQKLGHKLREQGLYIVVEGAAGQVNRDAWSTNAATKFGWQWPWFRQLNTLVFCGAYMLDLSILAILETNQRQMFICCFRGTYDPTGKMW